MTIIANRKTGQALGRMSLSDPLGWVDAPFASTFANHDEAQEVAFAVFGAVETLMGDISIDTV